MSDIIDPVTPYYREYLKREPEAEGFQYWTNVFYKILNTEGLAAAQLKLKEGFISSPEYRALNAA